DGWFVTTFLGCSPRTTIDTPIAPAATSTRATPATDGHSLELARRPAVAERNIRLLVPAASSSCPCCFAKTSLMSRRRSFIPIPPGRRPRSEERRVGKECRARWAGEQLGEETG